MKEIIFVGISSEIDHSRDLSRRRDFTPAKALGYKDQTGEVNKHIAFLRDQVIPYIEKNYHNDPGQGTYVGDRSYPYPCF